MKEFYCQRCSKLSFSATKGLTECPHCSVERHLIINPEIFSIGDEFSNAKVVIDRRTSAIPVGIERRGNSVSVPIGWLVTVKA